MTARVRTLIVGAGQAGLALSRHLTDMNHEHMLLERGRIAERWRSERWDSFSLLTPNWQTRLPGYQYDGPDPDGFMNGRQVIDFFDRYARSFDAPVRTGVAATHIEPAPHGWAVHTGADQFEAASVVIATGYYDRPAIPAAAAALPTNIYQLHATRYRNPDQLPAGTVLVVGAGPTGQQIADELACAGRQVYLAVGRHRPLPRRYRGKDVYWWMEHMRMLDRTVDSLPVPASAHQAPSVVLAGGEYDLNLHHLVRHGVVPIGRLQQIDGGRFRFADDLPTRVAEADANVERLRSAVDTHIELSGMDAPLEDPTRPAPAAWAHKAPTTIDSAAAGLTTVLWATGYGRDYSWINAPAVNTHGEPTQRRGVTAMPGLYFLGLRWMYRRKSNFIDGVGEDAEYLADYIVHAERRYARVVSSSSRAASTAWRRLPTASLARIAAT